MKRLVIAVLLCLLHGPALAETAVATFAGGCFWCMEPPYDKVDGVLSTISGYTGGHVNNPSYRQVSSGRTGHYESLQVKYDPDKVSYRELLDIYWHNIDPFDDGGQFCDRGPQYRAAIFAETDRQSELARESKQALQEKIGAGQRIVTQILPAKTFYPAEEYHQDYYQKNSLRYKFYRYSCGRDQRLEEVREIIWPQESKG
jgi:peptide-methionine (S)-S-oxide reductase